MFSVRVWRWMLWLAMFSVRCQTWSLRSTLSKHPPTWTNTRRLTHFAEPVGPGLAVLWDVRHNHFISLRGWWAEHTKQVTFIFVIAINSQSSLDEVFINETIIAALTFGVRQHVNTNNQCTDVHTHRHTAILLVHVCTDICMQTHTQTHAQTEGKRQKLTDTKIGRHSNAQTDRQTGRQS